MTVEDDARHIIGCLKDTRDAVKDGHPELIEEKMKPVSDHDCELCQGVDLYITSLGMVLSVAPPDRQDDIRTFLLSQINEYIVNLENAI